MWASQLCYKVRVASPGSISISEVKISRTFGQMSDILVYTVINFLFIDLLYKCNTVLAIVQLY